MFLFIFFCYVEIESSPVRCLVSEVKNTACGGEFTVWLSSIEGASILYGLWISLDYVFFIVLVCGYQWSFCLLVFSVLQVFHSMDSLVMEQIMRYYAVFFTTLSSILFSSN